MIEFDVKIKAGDLYDYMLRHTYNSFSGMLGSGLGALMVIAGIYLKGWLMVIAGVVLLCYLPWTLFLKSRQQMLANPAFKEPLHYVLDEEGIHVPEGHGGNAALGGYGEGGIHGQEHHCVYLPYECMYFSEEGAGG